MASIYNNREEVRFTVRIPASIKSLVDILREHRKISLNDITVEAFQLLIKDAVLNNMLPAAVEAREHIPVQYVTAKILARLETADDAAREIRNIGLTGAAATYEIFETVRRMLSSDVKDAIDRDIQKNGPLIYYPPGDPNCKTIDEVEKLSPKPITTDQHMSQADIHQAGAFLDETEADELLRRDIMQANASILDDD